MLLFDVLRCLWLFGCLLLVVCCLFCVCLFVLVFVVRDLSCVVVRCCLLFAVECKWLFYVDGVGCCCSLGVVDRWLPLLAVSC